MRKLTDKFIVTFPSTAAAMAMENYSLSHGIPGRLIPVPSEISAGCGMCWCAEIADGELCKKAVEEGGLDFEEYFVL